MAKNYFSTYYLPSMGYQKSLMDLVVTSVLVVLLLFIIFLFGLSPRIYGFVVFFVIIPGSYGLTKLIFYFINSGSYKIEVEEKNGKAVIRFYKDDSIFNEFYFIAFAHYWSYNTLGDHNTIFNALGMKKEYIFRYIGCVFVGENGERLTLEEYLGTLKSEPKGWGYLSRMPLQEGETVTYIKNIEGLVGVLGNMESVKKEIIS